MPKWASHFDELVKVTNSLSRSNIQDTLFTIPTPTPTPTTLATTTPSQKESTIESPLPSSSSSLEATLATGMEVCIKDLTPTPAGWLYRQIPVMVFGVYVKECDDLALRKEFYHRVHLSACCGALEESSQTVWIGTNLQKLQCPWTSEPLRLCEFCLNKSHADAPFAKSTEEYQHWQQTRPFEQHVSAFSQYYFPQTHLDEKIQYWQSESTIRSLTHKAASPEPTNKTTLCHRCGWETNVDDESRQRSTPQPHPLPTIINDELASTLNVSKNTCLPCAQHTTSVAISLPEQENIELHRRRFHALKAQAKTLVQSTPPLQVTPSIDALENNTDLINSTPTAEQQTTDKIKKQTSDTPTESLPLNWSDVYSLLPPNWHPLITALSQQLEPPQLFTTFLGYTGFAVMSWPQHRKGIIADSTSADDLPDNWEFWHYGQVLKTLGN
ncbi:hypothetical protein [Marinibactrum halimedae]|uniref:Uncharacterized protein n=1 Tax=Marinibactrum halimedae TaxID=1444977 RepID=A0AA37T5D7_9GAMM|nr:hypothetical protein [Marinibactrum halimedae]MCD9460565.1 hypothetical protein [Marinibactrum halimedae]GLS27195.1 hypothetical protein GCM10007877_29140 [Marinibactrum halimedae]